MSETFITPFCITAYVVCKTPDGPRYLLIRRCGKDWPGTWQAVTGGIDDGETAAETALREIREETGLDPIEMYCANGVEAFYIPARKQIGFAPVFIAFVEKLNVRLSPTEHDAYEWLPFESARQRLKWDEQRRMISLVHECYVEQTSDDLHRIDVNQLSEAPLDFIIRPMNAPDIDRVAHLYLPWSTMKKTTDKWQKYYEEQQQNIRTVAVVEKNEQILGYGSLLRQSEYPHFSNMPEISDVWIYEQHRRQGFGKRLLLWLEALARREGCAQVGIGVGLYKDYGAAQQLYFQLGYKPDGRGITYKHASVVPGESYPVDDDLIFWLTKSLSPLSEHGNEKKKEN